MHPAFSVIFFTTASGAGYGLLALLGILTPLGLVPPDWRFGVAGLGLALALITAGLISSTLHLGHPERSWRAFSQWRSSWLSCEGVASMVTYAPALLLALGWIVLGRVGGLFAAAGGAATMMAAVTVYCTAMIYRSLKPIHQWANGWVVPNYLALALMTGALWVLGLLGVWGASSPPVAALAAASIVAAAFLKLRYWNFIDTTRAASTPETATGLGARGTVRLFEAPYTADNYLMKEMGYRIARKHAARLRQVVLFGAFGLPLVLLLLSLMLPVAALPAALVATAGVLVERWLFFAEAKHTVTLYYGARAV
jgi:DMSO reductase anchor subunit